MKKNKLFPALIILCSFSGIRSDARDTLDYRLPRLTVTANRYEKDPFETHLPVQALDLNVIINQGQTNLGEFIDQLPGVTMEQSGPWSEKPVIRGLSGTHVLTLVDGMKLDVLRAYGNHAPLVDVNQIERVEVIRGPGSVLYGSNAIAGVINIITKQPHPTAQAYALNSQMVMQYASVNRQLSELLDVTGQYGKTSLALNLTHRKADNINTPSGILQNTAFSGYTADAKIGLHLTRAQAFLISGHLTRFNDVGVPINPKAQKAHFTQYDRNRLAAIYTWRRSGDMIRELKATAYYQQGNREFDAFLYHVPKGPLFVNNALNANRDISTYGGTLQSGVSVNANHLLTWGADFFAEADDTRRISDPVVVTPDNQVKMDPPADLTPPTPKSRRNGWAVFIEDELNPAGFLTFNSGVRYDAIQSHADGVINTLTPTGLDCSDSDISGGFGTVIRLGSDMRLTANIGRAFKAPTLQERFFKGTAQVGTLEGNPDLKSETSLNFDLGFKYRIGRWDLSVHGFDNTISDFIVMKPANAAADSFVYDNVGKAELYGAEVDVSCQLLPSLRLSGNGAYVRGQDTELNENLPKMPPLNGLFSIRFNPLNAGYWIEMQAQFTSGQDKVAINESTTDGYSLYHFSSGMRLQPFCHRLSRLNFTLNIRNIFNQSYRNHLSTVTWWDAPGRNIIVGLQGDF